MNCIRCEQDSLAMAYMWNEKMQSYEIEYHCEQWEGGCGFYRILPMSYNGVDFEEEEE